MPWIDQDDVVVEAARANLTHTFAGVERLGAEIVAAAIRVQRGASIAETMADRENIAVDFRESIAADGVADFQIAAIAVQFSHAVDQIGLVPSPEHSTQPIVEAGAAHPMASTRSSYILAETISVQYMPVRRASYHKRSGPALA